MLRQTWVNYMAYSHHAGYRFFYSLARVCFMKYFMANPDELCSDKANGQNLCSAEDCSMLSRVFTPVYACFKDLYRPLSLCVRQSASSHQYVAIATRSSMELLKKKTTLPVSSHYAASSLLSNVPVEDRINNGTLYHSGENIYYFIIISYQEITHRLILSFRNVLQVSNFA